MRAWGWRRSALWLHAPELKAFLLDRLFNGPPREVVRRRLKGAESASPAPRTELDRKLAAFLVACEGMKVVLRLRGEHADAHRTAFRGARGESSRYRMRPRISDKTLYGTR